MSTQTELRTIEHVIGGAGAAGESTRTSLVWDPAAGEPQAQVLLAEPADVDRAVKAAREALPGWANASLARRSKVMFRFRELLERNVDELARMIASEHGKVVDDAKGEIARGLEVVEFVCGLPQLLKGEYSDEVSTGIDAHSFRQPLGVCAGITPFNFPVMVPLWMHPVAIATGNTFILKPSERDPSASNLIARALPRCRSARRGFQCRPRRQGRGRCHPRPSRHRGGLLRRLDADRTLRPRTRHEAGQACPGARWRQEPRRRDA